MSESGSVRLTTSQSFVANGHTFAFIYLNVEDNNHTLHIYLYLRLGLFLYNLYKYKSPNMWT